MGVRGSRTTVLQRLAPPTEPPSALYLSKALARPLDAEGPAASQGLTSWSRLAPRTLCNESNSRLPAPTIFDRTFNCS